MSGFVLIPPAADLPVIPLILANGYAGQGEIGQHKQLRLNLLLQLPLLLFQLGNFRLQGQPLLPQLRHLQSLGICSLADDFAYGFANAVAFCLQGSPPVFQLPPFLVQPQDPIQIHRCPPMAESLADMFRVIPQ